MFALNFRDSGCPEIAGQRVMLRHPVAGDYPAWAELRAQSREFLQPWEPTWHRDDLTRTAFRQRLRRYAKEIENGTGLPYLIFDANGETLFGGITIGHIRRGVAQNAQIGYWIGEPFAGKGLMSEALGMACNHAFTRCGLHRLEAACIPDNNRSLRLLEKSGFEREGELRAYLKINGQWRDHILFGRINPADRAL